jgi:hypothetical protein
MVRTPRDAIYAPRALPLFDSGPASYLSSPRAVWVGATKRRYPIFSTHQHATPCGSAESSGCSGISLDDSLVLARVPTSRWRSAAENLPKLLNDATVIQIRAAIQAVGLGSSFISCYRMVAVPLPRTRSNATVSEISVRYGMMIPVTDAYYR